MKSCRWLMLVISVPGKSTTPRMRIWRALKAGGAGIMRDGVYLLPEAPAHRQLLEKLAGDVHALDGTAFVLAHETANAATTAQIRALFDRSADYTAWQERALAFKARLPALTEAQARREQAQHRRELEALASIDFFPGEPHDVAQDLLGDVDHELHRMFSPDEPRAAAGAVSRRDAAEYTGRCWVTRANLWVDRVASAWLIKRFIDPDATFLWLSDVAARPPDCVGFDFDGATFTHVERYVTFEVLTQSFDLHTDVALRRVASLVHYLDVGGAPLDEAAGLLALLSGARERSATDDEFLARASELLDHLYVAFRDRG